MLTRLQAHLFQLLALVVSPLEASPLGASVVASTPPAEQPLQQEDLEVDTADWAQARVLAWDPAEVVSQLPSLCPLVVQDHLVLALVVEIQVQAQKGVAFPLHIPCQPVARDHLALASVAWVVETQVLVRAAYLATRFRSLPPQEKLDPPAPDSAVLEVGRGLVPLLVGCLACLLSSRRLREELAHLVLASEAWDRAQGPGVV